MNSTMRNIGRQRAVLGAILGLVLIMAAALTLGCSGGSAGEGGSEGGSDRPLAPSFSGTTMDGAQVSLGDYAGKPVVLVFMASWCGPCREEAPELELFYQQNQERAALLAIAVSDTEEDISAFMTENGLTFPLMLDGDSVANAYGVSAIPTTVVVDPDGRIAKRIIGGTTAAALSLVIDGITR